MSETRPFLHDLQASAPDVRIGLSRAGVTGVEKAIRLRQKLIPARIDCTVDLPPSQKGVHMSRFPELFEEAIEEVVTEAFLVEELAEHVARHIVARQSALRAEVRIEARYPRRRKTPVTGLSTQELVTLIGIAASMSAPIYELLKRPDELFVVEHAHLQPRFVEDSVRAALAATLHEYPQLADGDFLFSRQVNFETIHAHEVVAERYGTVAELRAELHDGGGHGPLKHTELRDWLRA